MYVTRTFFGQYGIDITYDSWSWKSERAILLFAAVVAIVLASIVVATVCYLKHVPLASIHTQTHIHIIWLNNRVTKTNS